MQKDMSKCADPVFAGDLALFYKMSQGNIATVRTVLCM